MEPSATVNRLEQSNKEVADALLHFYKLLRVRNQLFSPLLRLPTEIVVRILSYIMDDLDSLPHPWTSIYSTSHGIHRIMCNATELWWRVDCAHIKKARIIYTRSQGSPRILLSDIRSKGDDRLFKIEKTFDHWRKKIGFKAHRLTTLQFCGSLASFYHFYWVLERPLPRVEHLKLYIMDSVEEYEMEPLQAPIVLVPSLTMPLRILDLRNITIPWSTHYPLVGGLRELHLCFKDCEDGSTIPEDEMFGIFDAAQQLERLSLLRVGHEIPLRDRKLVLPPKRVVQLPSLKYFSLDNEPRVIKYSLACMDLPVLETLILRTFISWDVAHALVDLIFPDDRIPTRLLAKTPTFRTKIATIEGVDATIEAEIGNVDLQLEFPLGQAELGRSTVMASLPQLVPPSITALKLECTSLTEQGWRDFLTSRPEIQSIECTEFYGAPASKALWDALSPTGGEDTIVPCTRLESIHIISNTGDLTFLPLSNCLRSRQAAGFKLKHLKLVDNNELYTPVDGFHKEFNPLVEKVEVQSRGSKDDIIWKWGVNQPRRLRERAEI